MLNYYPKVIESMLHTLHQKDWDAKPKSREMLSILIDHMDVAKKWVLTAPAAKMLHSTRISREVLKVAWLPHDKMILEYDYPFDYNGTRTGEPFNVTKKRVVYITTIRDLEWERMKQYQQTIGGKYDQEFTPDIKRRLAILVFWELTEYGRKQNGWSHVPEMWMMSPYVMMVTDNSVNHLDEWCSGREFRFGARFHSPFLSSVYPPEEHPYLFNVKDGVFDMKTPKESFEMLLEETMLTLAVIGTADTGSLPLESIPAPDKLNRKRRKKGRVLIPDYTLLNITRPKSLTARVGQEGEKGMHASPIAHYRSGHVRRQWYPRKQEHKTKWIKPVLVGTGPVGQRPVKVL